MGLLSAIGAGVGAIGGAIGNHQKKVQFNRDKELAAVMEKNSPWTGVHGKMPEAVPSLFGDIAGGGLGGGMMGNNVAQAGGIGGWGAAANGAAPLGSTIGAGGSTPWSGMSAGGGSNFWDKNPYSQS